MCFFDNILLFWYIKGVRQALREEWNVCVKTVYAGHGDVDDYGKFIYKR